MLKKISAVTVLSATLLFGGAITTSAQTAKVDNSDVHTYSKIIYSANGNWDRLNLSNWESYLNDYFAKWNDYKTVQKPVEQPQQNQVQKPVQKPVEQPQQNQVQKPVQKPVQQESGSQLSQLNEFEQQVFELTNNERIKNGLAPLKVDLELSRVAREKSQDMATKHYFDHNSPTYGSPFDMMKAYGITYQSAGENIARGQSTPEEVVKAWMNSPGHRENILKASYTHIGIGYIAEGNHWTQQFIGK